MADEKYVPAEAFAKIIKGQLKLIHDLSLAVTVLRSALQRSESFPVPTEFLQQLDADLRELPAFRETREAIARINETDSLADILKGFEGPIQ